MGGARGDTGRSPMTPGKGRSGEHGRVDHGSARVDHGSTLASGEYVAELNILARYRPFKGPRGIRDHRGKVAGKGVMPLRPEGDTGPPQLIWILPGLKVTLRGRRGVRDPRRTMKRYVTTAGE